MKKTNILLILLLLIVFSYGYSQETFIVTAENGLILRNQPNVDGEKIGKLYFGAEVSIVENTKKTQTVLDNGKIIKGTWVKIAFKNDPVFISNAKLGYVFNGYLQNKSNGLKTIVNKIVNHPDLQQYSIAHEKSPYYITGDFFNDKINDIAILLKDKDSTTKIIIINYSQQKRELHFLGKENDPFDITDYNWVGIFKKVESGEVLWSNYEDDFIAFKDVPESKKVKLSYDAIYIHASESCGGGFVYWKDGKFNWLQQE